MKAGIMIGHLKDKGNISSIIRTGEAFGINNVFVIGKKEHSYKQSKGADRHVNFYEIKDMNTFITFARKNNYSIVCIENVNDAIDISQIKKYPCNPIFISGNEGTGVSNNILRNAKLIVKIEQGFGYVRCLNTSVASAIVIHDFYQKHLKNRVKQWENG